MTTNYEDFIHISRYARFIPEENRRETYSDTVDRWWNYMVDKFPSLEKHKDVREAILNKEVMPSMRTMMAAGDALERNHIAAYNLSLIHISEPTRPY